MRSGALDIIVADSVAALVPKAEIDGGVGLHRSQPIGGHRMRLPLWLVGMLL